MKLIVEFRDQDGTLLHHFVQGGTTATIPLGVLGSDVASIAVEVLEVDQFLADHVDEIVGVAAMAVAWRNEQRKPHPDRASQVASLKEFMRYSAVLDTISDDVRGWLMMRKPRTELKVMEGG